MVIQRLKSLAAVILLIVGMWFAVDMITGFNPYRNAVMLFAAITCIMSSAALIGLFKE